MEIDKKGAKFNGTIPSGNVLVDGLGVGDIGSVVLRDRKHLSEDGLVIVALTLDDEGLVLSGPDIVSRGFVYVKESGDLLREAKQVVNGTIEKTLSGKSKRYRDLNTVRTAIKDDLAKFIYKETKRRPMILSVIMSV